MGTVLICPHCTDGWGKSLKVLEHRAWIPLWRIPNPCSYSLHLHSGAASKWMKESRDVFVEQTLCMFKEWHHLEILPTTFRFFFFFRVNFHRKVKMGTSIPPSSPILTNTKAVIFTEKKRFRREKGLAGWGTLPSLLDSHLERSLGWRGAERGLGLQP